MQIKNNCLSEPTFNAKKIPQKVVTNFCEEFKNPKIKKVDIYCHSSADEDTINSAKALASWLYSINKKVRICVNSSESKPLFFDSSKYKIKRGFSKADKAILVDFNSWEKFPEGFKEALVKMKLDNVFCIDHHEQTSNIISKKAYIDESAKSCCSVIYRLLDQIGFNMNKDSLMDLYCGMISDLKKSKYVEFFKKDGEYIIKKAKKILNDKNTLKIYNEIDHKLEKSEKNIVLSHLDVLSRLTPLEKKFQKELFSNVKFSQDKKIAYVVIESNDYLWNSLGMDNPTTSEILKDFRIRILENAQNDNFINDKKSLKNVKNVITFYRKSPDSCEYKMSIHSKNNTALKLIDKAKTYNKNFVAGGHEDRAGGKINSIDKDSIKKFIEAFVQI